MDDQKSVSLHDIARLANIADFFQQKFDYTGKNRKSRFVPPFRGLRCNVHGSSRARWKARGRLPVSAI